MLTRKGKVVVLLLALLFVISLLLALISQNYLEAKLTAQISDFGIPALFLFSAIFEFVPSFLGPHIDLVAAFLSGMSIPVAVIVTIAGSTFGTLIAFEVGRLYGVRYVDDLIDENNEKKLELLVHKYGRLGVFLTSFTPLPYMPLVFGAIGVPFRVLLVYGIIPRILSFIVMGLFPSWFFSFFLS